MKPIPPKTPSRYKDRKTNRTNLTSLKPVGDFFFPCFPPKYLPLSWPSFFFYSFFLPPFTFFTPSSSHLLFIVLFQFLLKFLLLIFPQNILIPSSFVPYHFYSLFPSFLLFFFPLLSLFPTGETIKPGALKKQSYTLLDR